MMCGGCRSGRGGGGGGGGGSAGGGFHSELSSGGTRIELPAK